MAEVDKSKTHQRVIKGGEYGWIHQDVWAEMVKKNKKNGFEAIISDPPEVQIMKQKKTEEPVVEVIKTTKGKKGADDVDDSLTGGK